MKNKVFLGLLVFVVMFIIVGCSNEGKKEDVITPTEAPKKEVIEPNSKVGYLRFYAPSDYTYRPDLRGLAYDESQKKVYIKGDYENNITGVIYLITALEFNNKDVKEYIDEVNTKLSDKDVKYSLKTNSKNQEVYVRENYIINGNVNYAYILGKSGDIYVVNIRGPQDKSVEITKVATNVLDSLYIS